MSRVGKQPVILPQGVDINILNNTILVKGKKGELKNSFPDSVKIFKEDNKIIISPINNNLLKEFTYNPDEINQFSMSRIVGLGLTLIKDISFTDETLNSDQTIQQLNMNIQRANIQDNYNSRNS